MKYLYLANNRLARDIALWLADRNEPPIAVVVHPAEKAKYREAIVEATGVAADRVLDGSRLREAETLAVIRDLGAEMSVSVLFDYILQPEFLSLFPRGCFNLHPALLPYNRGQYPDVWSIVERTPAGVTLHRIDKDIDTGDIVEQSEVEVSPADTAETLYRKLEGAALDLFRKTWPRLLAGDISLRPQAQGSGTYHRTRDVERIDHIDLDRQYTGRELIDILRARTFPPYRGAYFIDEGRRVYLRLTLEPEQDG